MPVDPTLSAQAPPAFDPTVLPGTQPGQPNVAHVQTGGAAGGALKIAQDLMAMHQAKQATAMQDFNKNVKAHVDWGVPLDMKHMAKLLKTAGIHVATKPEDLQGHIDIGHGAAPGPTPGSVPGGGTNGQGTAASPQMGPQNPVQQVQQGKQTRKQQQELALEQMATNAVQKAVQEGQSVQKVKDLQALVTQAKIDAMSPDPVVAARGAGQLMNANEIPWDIGHAQWNAMTPEQKQFSVRAAAHYETESEKNTRITNIANQMQADGRYTDPAMAYKAATAIVNGVDVPPDVQSNMKPFTFKELADQATFAEKAVELGLPPEQLPSFLKAAAVGGLPNALPTKMNPVILQELSVRQQQLDVEKQQVKIQGEQAATERTRVDLEEQHYQNEAKKLDVAAAKEENEEFFTRYRALLDAKKAGVTIPNEIMNAYNADLAQRVGLDVTEADNLFHWLTGGTHPEYKTKPAVGASSTMAGGDQDQPSRDYHKSSPNTAPPPATMSPKYLQQLNRK